MVCLIIGIILQFCLTSHPFIGSIIGSLIILIAPLILCSITGYKSFDECSPAVKWKTITRDQEDAFIRMLNSPQNPPKFGHPLSRFFNRCCLNSTLKAIFIFIMISAWMVQIESEEFDINVLNIAWDIIFIPSALLRIKYGNPDTVLTLRNPNGISPDLQRDKITTLQGIHCSLLPFCTPEFQAELSHTNYTIVTDLRVQARFKEEIPNLLCAMFSVSMNSVKETKYPYAYFVYVFKGSKIKHNKHLIENLQSLTDETAFGLEITPGEDNKSTVFVVTKKLGRKPYYTDSDDCSDLISLFHNYYQTFIKYLN